MSDLYNLSRRADKPGQEMMSQASLWLLIYLSMKQADRMQWSRVLPAHRDALGINELDLKPLEKAGWVKLAKSGADQLLISITDAGDACCRNLLDWAKLGGKGVAA